MKTYIIIAGLLLMFTANAQMSQQSYFPFSYLSENTKNMRYQPDILISNDNPTYYGAAAVLISTFFVNKVIIRNAENKGNFKNTTRNVGAVYIIGVTSTIGICVLENRLIKNRRKAQLQLY